MPKELINKIDKIWSIEDPNKIQNHLSYLAEMILLEYQLNLNDSLYDITEIEFYVNKQGHDDPFVHKHYGYKTGQFRIHGAGIDIALGNGIGYGGILLRSIRKQGETILIPSPIKVCDYIIANMGNIEKSSISMVPKKIKCIFPIHQTPRIGLNPKDKLKSEQQVEFIVSPYRYFTLDQLHAEKYIKALILEKTTDLEDSTLNEYKASYESGKKITNPYEVATGYFNLIAKAKLLGYYSVRR
jgi:hypothetical protein